jgi:16S rRNA (guanine966-N2)-methyltransferase
MRIIAGRYKGRTLHGPTGAAVRPTSDRLRETLFNIIAGDVPGARVLDGFAGTGALGLEALSRGATRAVFVERDRRAIEGITRNVAACGIDSDAYAIIRGDFLGLGARRSDIGPFDLALLDPPYDYADLDAVLAEAAGLLKAQGLVVLELSRRRDAPETVAGLSRRRTVRAGDSVLAFYRPAVSPRHPDPPRHHG